MVNCLNKQPAANPALISAAYPLAMAAPLHILGAVGSALDEAWNFYANDQLPEWGSVLAASQNKGRGRMAKEWQSPPGHIYAALRLPAAEPFNMPGGAISLAALLSLALNGLRLETAIKWPNDLIVKDGKAGGILVESRGGILMAGVGLNLNVPPGGDWAREPGAPKASAFLWPGEPEKLWALILKEIISYYRDAEKKMTGLDLTAHLMKEAEKKLIWRNKLVKVKNPAGKLVVNSDTNEIFGYLTGLSPEGLMRLKTAQGELEVWSGTVLLEQK